MLRLAFGAVLFSLALPAHAAEFLVRTPSEYAAAADRAQAGDTIVLGNGEWRDFQILFTGKGAADKPIRLTAQTKGQVILTGQSNLRIGGEYLEVSGLVFRNGWSPTDHVIAFRKDSKTYAHHSRVTEIVIDRFNKPDRRADDIWIAIYGQDNRIDHAHLEGKANAGVTLAVIRDKGHPEENRARIDHNYFGPRPPLGSNGGETIRIGTSDESLSDSRSIVERNIFDRCDGEVEIVSVKSGGNILRENLVLQSQGAFVLRHGNGNLVERNVFLGGNKPDTGGVRVINRDQVVRFNYFQDLAGKDLKSALAVMNGVPNSVINRYHQVANAVIERNSFVNVARVTFAAGADAERSASPVASRFADNLVLGAKGKNPITAVGDASGIALTGNVMAAKLARASNGLLYPEGSAAGAPRDLAPVTRGEVGVAWYRPVAAAHRPRTIAVAPGRSLADAIAGSGEGDTIALDGVRYDAPGEIAVGHRLVIRGAGKDRTRIVFTGPALFSITGGSGITLEGLAVEARSAGAGAVVRIDPAALGNYSLLLTDMAVDGTHARTGLEVIATAPGTFADRIEIRRSSFAGVSGAVVAAAAEQGSKGWYPVENLVIAESDFAGVGLVADLLRRGTDESTFGPYFTLEKSNVAGSGKRQGASVRISGAQWTTIKDNNFAASAPIEVTHSVGTPSTVITGNAFAATPAPVIRELSYRGPQRAVVAGNRVGS
ncbi:polysaccharide lyase 6 family protein [Sphingomonas sp. DT-207]|uniref:polysaccharide lyase 6 family protein n=1 Tax=Sphingomonas sp. DT-207 TaxID=3396167 RepID=UPI003F1BA584